MTSERRIFAFPHLPMDDVPQRVAGYGLGAAATSFRLVPTAYGKGVTLGPPQDAPQKRAMSASQFSALLAASGANSSQMPPVYQMVEPAAQSGGFKVSSGTLAKVMAGAKQDMPVASLLPAPPILYAPRVTAAPSGGDNTALIVGAIALCVVVGAYVVARKKG